MGEPGRYPWILKRPARERHLPPVRESGQAVVVCGRCGWESKGRRKKCPACMARLSGEVRTS